MNMIRWDMSEPGTIATGFFKSKSEIYGENDRALNHILL
jgi:hypothetical protein